VKNHIIKFFLIAPMIFLTSCAAPKVLKVPNMKNVGLGSSEDALIASAGSLFVYEWDKKGDSILNQMFTYVYLKNGAVIAIEQDPIDKFERDPNLKNNAIARTNEIKSYYRQLNSARLQTAASNFATGMAMAQGGMASRPLIQQQPRASNPTASFTPIASASRYNQNSLANPYGAGSPYKPDGLMNPYSPYGSPYSNRSWTNPYATDAPKLYDSQGNYRGRLSSNPYASDSTSNPYGRYGSPYSSESINNPYGAGNPYSTKPIYVVPQR
jgi:hypothetical protein